MATQQMTVQIDRSSLDKYTRSVRVVASTPNPVEGQAAITGWDLSRFLKNPVVLWAHSKDLIPIGSASEIEWNPDVGLTMRITLASGKVSELAEQVWNGILEEVIRAVSVGYDPPDAGGSMAKLAELSVVPVGMDEDAGTPALNPDAAVEEGTTEQMKEAVKRAASMMAKHRARIQRAKVTAKFDCGEGEVLRMDRSPLRLDSMEDTPAGGKRIPARLSRVGVLTYITPDGPRRELVPPKELFKADSMSTLNQAPVIDIRHHTGMVTPDTYQRVALGHAHGVKENGKFLQAHLDVNDRETLDAIANGDRTEISAGYRCRLLMQPGEWEGQKYDCVQVDRVYNHVALCPPNRGRAGPEVGLRFDGNGTAPAWGIAHTEKENRNMDLIVRLDGREVKIASQDHLDTLLSTLDTKSLAKVIEIEGKMKAKDVELVDVQKKLDAVTGERDAAKTNLDAFKKETDDKKKADDEKAEKEKATSGRLKKARKKLERMALRFFSREKDFDEDDEDKMDKLDEFIANASDRDLRLKVIAGLPGGDKFDAKEKSDEYVNARFDAMIDNLGSNLGRGVDDVVVEARRESVKLDANDSGGKGLSSLMAKAREERAKGPQIPSQYLNGASK